MTLTEDDFDAAVGMATRQDSLSMIYNMVMAFTGKYPTDVEMAEILRGVADEIDPELE